MAAISDIAGAVGQVRSEMRVARARELPLPAMAFVSGHIGHLEEGIQRFIFSMPGTQRRDPQVQQLIRDLRRLREDLILFFTAHDLKTSPDAPAHEGLVISPLRGLTAMLKGKFP